MDLAGPGGDGSFTVAAAGRLFILSRGPCSPARHGHPTGIAFDATGYFGRKLLVTVSNHAETSVLAIDCTGGVRVITSHARPWRAASASRAPAVSPAAWPLAALEPEAASRMLGRKWLRAFTRR